MSHEFLVAMFLSLLCIASNMYRIVLLFFVFLITQVWMRRTSDCSSVLGQFLFSVNVLLRYHFHTWNQIGCRVRCSDSQLLYSMYLLNSRWIIVFCLTIVLYGLIVFFKSHVIWWECKSRP